MTDAAVSPGGGLTHGVGFLTDIATISRRAVRSVVREPEYMIPALIIPVFFFVVNTGALESFVEGQAPSGSNVGLDYRAFQLPVAIIFAVTGISRASVLVIDIQSGYLDRMLVTPIRRSTLLFGLMVADIVMALGLALFVVVMGLAFGVWFETGVLGLLVFLLLAIAWSVAYSGIPYTVALRTGNPAAVNSSFLIFFPFAFLTPSFLPRELMSGWLRAAAGWNPVTYLMEAMRSILFDGWDGVMILKGAAAIVGLAIVTFYIAFRSLGHRVATG